MDTELIPRYVIAKELNITYLRKIERIILEYSLKPLKVDSRGVQYFDKRDFIFLKNKQTELIKYFNENFYTYSECHELGLNSFHMEEAISREVPELIRVNKYHARAVVYEKDSIRNLIETVKRREKSFNITQISKILGVKYQFTNTILQEWGITPKEKSLGNYFDSEVVDYLLEKQAERYKYFTENYYTSKEIEALGVTSYRGYFKEVKGQNIDSIAKVDKLENLRVVYPRKVVDEFLENKRLKEEKERLEKEREQKRIATEKNKQLEKEKKQKRIVKEMNKQLKKEKKRAENEEQKKDEAKETNTFNVISENVGMGGYLKDRIADELQMNLTTKELIEILNEHNISYYYITIEEIEIYDRKEINVLRDSQSKQYSYYVQNYYTSAEVRRIGLSVNSMKLKKVPVPQLIKFKKFKRNTVLYEKGPVNKSVKAKKINSIIDDEIEEVYSNPYNAYKIIIKEVEIKFSRKSVLTEKYWKAYVENFLYTSKGSKITVKRNIKKFVALTELLVSVTKEKEIFAFTARELNLLLFNEKVFQGYREFLFSFINKVNESLPQEIINVELLNNPYAEKRGKRKLKTNKEIYTTNEFVDLLDYVSKTDLHIKRALEDVNNYFKGVRVHKKYDSAWLYILLHMNNGWRSSDIASFPRIDLSLIGIRNLKDYSESALSIEDARKLITQIGVKMPFIHSKNQQKRYFFCSEELVYPLANAIIICELRTREYSPDNDSIIDFINARQELLKSAHDNFFVNFSNKKFKFSSLKMNRTFITFMTSIVKEKTGRNPLEISKFIRNHSDIDTTNIYIEIPKEHLDILTEQLFDTGYFGYTYELLATVLLNKSESPDERVIQTIEMVKDVFGDIYKVENLSGYINLIKHESRALGDYLNEQSADEISKKLNLIHLGQLPGKEAYYQCLYGECIFSERDCSKCPFSIPHFHVLSSLGEKVNKRITEYKIAINDGIKGEKVKAANQLFSELLLLKQAKEKFGEEVVSGFMSINYDDLLLEIQSLDNPYEYMSITKKD